MVTKQAEWSSFSLFIEFYSDLIVRRLFLGCLEVQDEVCSVTVCVKIRACVQFLQQHPLLFKKESWNPKLSRQLRNTNFN